jgi:phosphatidylglycerol lysyltransferase
MANIERVCLPIMMMALLWLTRSAFKVRSDMRTFQQALWVSILVLTVAFLYGLAGFAILDDHDFHHEMSTLTAAHQTIDQLGLTTNHTVAYTRRARLFLDSLSVISIAAVGYAAISLFEPIRVRLANQATQRSHAALLLEEYPSDIDDYFKLWPHDKHYYFDSSGTAGLSYHVSRGVALIVGNPFGNPKRFKNLVDNFLELCFVNDWLPAFIHVDNRNRKLFESRNFKLQKIGEEAVVNLANFESVKSNKYFRQIRNRFDKLGYAVEVTQPPHDDKILSRLREISNDWLGKPGRAERGFMLGYFNVSYLQNSQLALLYDADHQIQGFINLVPTFEKGTANFDLLRCSSQAPGNANDFLMQGLIEYLVQDGVHTFNLGLCPLAGVDAPNSEETTLADQALRFMYANGDRFYSFSGLRRFKGKYEPAWEPRYIAYQGGIRNFTRALTALNRAMKIE